MRCINMERIGTVETTCRYPVKSMAGEDMAQAFIGFAGLMGDRAFAFVRTPGPKGFPWHTGREQEDLVLFRPHFREGSAAILPPDIEETFKMAPGVNPIFPAEGAFEIDVTTPDGPTLPLRSAELKAMIERRAGYAVTLRFSERSLYDCRPVSLFGNASARGLGDELAMPIDRRRFRANLYADRRTGRTGRTSWSGGPSKSGCGCASPSSSVTRAAR
jgi:uncharacterized protein